MATAVDAPPHPWHALTATDVVATLDTDRELGLSSEEAARRLDEYGPNQISIEPKWVRTKRLLEQFNDVLIWLLLIAAAVSGLLLGEWFDAAAIGAIVVLNAALGYAQESRAETALRRLEDLAAPEARVIRSGVVATIPAREVVPGDLILLEAGGRVPADGRILESIRLQVLEGSLTGESFPVEKALGAVSADSGVADRTSMVFATTAVASGRGRAIATATGRATEVGKIAELVAGEQPPTPLQIELARVGRRLAAVALAAAVLIFGAGLLRSYPIETMFLTAVALAVAAIPEGLPAVVTVSLAGGVQRMAQRNAIVRRLPAVEALGAVDVICTDKTGTLTINDLRVHSVVLGDGDGPPELLAEDLPAAKALSTIAALCNDAERTADGYAGDPTEIALLRVLDETGRDPDALRRDAPRLDEAGFDSRRKRMSTLHRVDGEYFLAVKGAPEVVIERCYRTMGSAGTVETLGDDARSLQLGHAEELAGRGLRMLAFAFRHFDYEPSDAADEEEGLTLVGLVGMRDEVRPEAAPAVREASRAGVRTVMVTGDHLVTATAIADEIGISGGDIMPGPRLRDTDEEALAETITGFRGFARVDPVDKVKIVTAWQTEGATVAMTGDGVNDAPALRSADIGVAMGSGTDVAREASALVLADDNYATIVAAIREGRRIFANVRNVVHYLLSANTSEILYMVVGFLAFGALGEPMLAVQLLWINLLSDALPALALGMDVPTRDLMQDPPGTGRDILSARNLGVLLVQGLILAAAAVLTLVAGYYVLDLPFEVVRTMVFSTLVFSQLLHAMNVRSVGARFRRPQPMLLVAIAASTVLQVAVVHLALGATFFETEPLSLSAWAWTVGASLLSFVVVRIYGIFSARRA